MSLTALSAMKRSCTEPWTAEVLPRLATLLQAAQYCDVDKEACLAFTAKHLLQNGTLTPAYKDDPLWPTYLTDDHSSIEYSIDVDASGSAKVRYAFEPVPESIAADPFNVHAPRAWLEQARVSVPSINSEWHDLLRDALTVGPHVMQYDGISASAAQAAQNMTQYFFALDFPKGDGSIAMPPMLKTYFMLDAVRSALGKEETMRRVNDCMTRMGLSQSWQVLCAYLDELKESNIDNGAQLEFISVDCVDRTHARCKPYIRFRSLTRTDFLRHLRMGRSPSALQPDEAAYVKLCEAVWDALCDEGASVAYNVAADSRDEQLLERTRGAAFYYELRADTVEDEVRLQPKAYLPVRHLLANDAEIARRIDEVLVVQSDGRVHPGWYTDMLTKFAGQRRELDRGAGMQTVVGIALKKGLPSISVYLSAEAHSYRD